MSDIGTHKGRWFCEGKPEDAHLGLVDDSLGRIQANTSQYANAQMAGPYTPNAPQSGNLPPGASPMSGRSMPQMQHQDNRDADFEDIEDDWAYRLAQQLYQAQPSDEIQVGRESFLLFPDDMAVLRITARRSVDLVDIETFRSERGLNDFWEEVLDYSEE